MISSSQWNLHEFLFFWLKFSLLNVLARIYIQIYRHNLYISYISVLKSFCLPISPTCSSFILGFSILPYNLPTDYAYASFITAFISLSFFVSSVLLIVWLKNSIYRLPDPGALLFFIRPTTPFTISNVISSTSVFYYLFEPDSRYSFLVLSN